MKKIFKYVVPILTSKFVMEMPEHHKILSFQMQDGRAYLWAIVDPETPLKSKGFHIYGTGQDMGYFGNYIGTVQERGYVWHLFED